MADIKPLASLSPSLLARKGAARPAMRAQSYFTLDTATPPPATEDLGWNDMGDDTVSAAIVPINDDPIPAPIAPPAIVEQQQALADRVAPSAELETKALTPKRAAAGSRGKAAFTLRLDPDRHLQLRLLSAVSLRSAQQIVTAALDLVLKERSTEISDALNKTRKD